MTPCEQSGCRHIEYRCKDCARVINTATLGELEDDILGLEAQIGRYEEKYKWISVKDQLPPENQEVLFFNGKKKVRFGFFRSCPPPVNNWATVSSIWINDLSYDEIGTATHWVPLPTPPKQ